MLFSQNFIGLSGCVSICRLNVSLLYRQEAMLNDSDYSFAR